jgi:hypothetical protein
VVRGQARLNEIGQVGAVNYKVAQMDLPNILDTKYRIPRLSQGFHSDFIVLEIVGFVALDFNSHL